MPTLHTLASARQLLPEARRRVAELAATIERVRTLVAAAGSDDPPPGVRAEAKAAEASADEQAEWFARRGIQLKGLDPPLLDFPARATRDGQPLHVLLCWRGDEADIATFHTPEAGFAGRRPVDDLDEV
jgi:hypothetical protein